MPDTVDLGGYTISFLGTQYADERETWTYSVIKNSRPEPEITSWTLELCFNPLHNVISSGGPGAVVIGQGKPCIPMAGRTIKWEQLNNDNVEGIYTFTLEGSYKKTERQVAVHAGPYCYRALITGPGCQENLKEEFPEKENYPEKANPEELFLTERSAEPNENSRRQRDQFENSPENQGLIVQPAEEPENEKVFQDTPPQFSTRGIKLF